MAWWKRGKPAPAVEADATDARDMPLIRLQGVSKVFKGDADEDTRALWDVSLDIGRGEYVSVSGPSGCGKSTFLAVLALLESPSSGRYWLNGRATDQMTPSERARTRNVEVGLIFQSFNLIGDMSVYENVEYPLTLRGASANERRQRVDAALERVGLTTRAKQRPGSLSGGHQQLVAIARAFAGRPPILLADEPTGNLDSKSGEAVMELLRQLYEGGATICMVTHDPRYARHAGRNIHLFDGRVVSELEARNLELAAQ
jgi:putative ABC transport system ATP-binding protein